MNGIPLLGGLSPEAFLRDYWQIKPLLVRQAYPDIRPMISADELAGLALEPEVPSRLVVQHSERQWDLRHGPFEVADFAELPQTHWTLLITDMEKFVPVLQELITPFRFIPDWRIDDLMISYAAPNGSVGPHIDAYDVFLLQIDGRRRWQIDTRSTNPNNQLPDSALHILAHFEAESEWILEPGDMLYLPPGIAHFGVAQGACMTASIGFRAPSQKDLVSAYLDDVVAQLDPERRFTDAGRTIAVNPGEIDTNSRNSVLALLTDALNHKKQEVERWFGRYITESRADLISLYPASKEWSASDLMGHISNGYELTRNTSARLAYFSQEETLFLYADGREYVLDMNLHPLVEVLCGHFSYPATLLNKLLKISPEASVLIATLLERGVLELA